MSIFSSLKNHEKHKLGLTEEPSFVIGDMAHGESMVLTCLDCDEVLMEFNNEKDESD